MKCLATLFLTALGLAAAPLTQVQLTNAGSPPLTVASVTIGGISMSNVYIGPYTMLINGQTTPALCIDFQDESSLNTTFNADVTPVGSKNLSDTYWPTYGTEYKEEAYLFNQIVQPGANRVALQEAAWEITSYGIVDSSYQAKYGDNSYTDSALTNFSSMNFSGYEIISDCFQHGEQEFLIQPAPEPGSLLLLSIGLLAGSAILAHSRRRAARARLD